MNDEDSFALKIAYHFIIIIGLFITVIVITNLNILIYSFFLIFVFVLSFTIIITWNAILYNKKLDSFKRVDRVSMLIKRSLITDVKIATNGGVKKGTGKCLGKELKDKD